MLAAALTAIGCEGREIAVFDVSGKLGSSGMGGAAGSMSDTGGAAAGVFVTTAGSGGGSAGAASVPGAGGGGSGSGSGGNGGSLTSDGGMAGVGGNTAPKPCKADVDCDPGWTCEKPGCDAPSGFCEPQPLFPAIEPMPVCGCNGVTYWNDDIRRRAGAQAASPGQCRSNACTCEVGSDCNVPDASCNHLVGAPDMCGHGMGACWVLPAQCTPGADTMKWQECKPPDAPPGPCIDTCTAIASEKSYAPPKRGTMCN
jgi:hypothetical protein